MKNIIIYGFMAWCFLFSKSLFSQDFALKLTKNMSNSSHQVLSTDIWINFSTMGALGSSNLVFHFNPAVFENPIFGSL